MAAIDNLKIYITSAGTNGSSVTTSEQYRGQITSVDQSGGEIETEVTNAFGGDIKIKQPRSDISVDIEVTPSETTDNEWASFLFGEDGTNTGSFTSAVEAEDKALFFEFNVDGTQQTIALNNCTVNTNDNSQEADGVRERSLTFSATATDVDGYPNKVIYPGAVTTMPDWTTFDQLA